ncbi:MAG: YlqD family protein [bacterium]|jgi:hypothetical protein|nr:YlqD family protein [bacterium]
MSETLTLRRQVVIKTIVTEAFKQQNTAQIQATLQNLDLQLQQLEFQGKRAIADLEKRTIATPSGPSQQVLELRAQIDQDRSQLVNAKNEMLQRLQMLSQIEVGNEVIEAQTETLVDVAIGDHIVKLLPIELVTKDGVVVEIRKPQLVAQA